MDHTTRISQRIIGRDLTLPRLLLAIFIVLLVVLVPFILRFNNPVPGRYASNFPEALSYQNIDMPVWLDTGLMLPHSAVPVRAPRPLYPIFIKLTQYLGITDDFRLQASGDSTPQHVWDQSIKTLITVNITLSILSLWLFFAACRYLKLDYLDALLATVVAGTGFGFSFWTSQLIPEVLSYFTVIAVLCLMVWAEEKNESGNRLLKWCLTGLFTGIFLLGKEVYFLVLIGLMYLTLDRRFLTATLFTICCAVPVILWQYYIVEIKAIFDPVAYGKDYGFLFWLKETLFQVPLKETITRLFINFSQQFLGILQAFVFVPVILAIVGITGHASRRELLYVFIFCVGFSAMFFASNFIVPRVCFMMWPLVYFFAWRGIMKISAKIPQRAGQSLSGPVLFKLAVVMLLAVIQNLPLYHFYSYG